MKLFSTIQSSRRSAFTMVEIALCLAIVGFALVAIIGVLPTGMNVQRDNRQETIIDQDAAVWLDTIRNGSSGYDDLTNYVISITNYWTQYRVTATQTNVLTSAENGYTRFNSHVTSIVLPDNVFPLTNGANIVGILSTPRYFPLEGPARIGDFTSNYVVAYVRAISGAAVEKLPQQNADILESAFAYKMIVENTSYVPVDPVNWSETNGMTGTQLSEKVAALQAREILLRSQQANARDLRLLMRWPLLPRGAVGNGRQTFRALAGGQILQTNHLIVTAHPLFFFQPSIYGAAQ
jgi:type II secretory pathway pseudopilin PulG